jgi:hypothetical protein
MQPVSNGEMRDHLLAEEREPTIKHAAQNLATSSPEEFDALLTAAGGAIGKALELLDEKKREPMLQNRALVTQLVTLLAARTRGDELLLALYALGSNRDEVGERLSLLQLALRDLLLTGLDDSAPLLFFTDRQAALDLSERFTATRLYAMRDAIEAATDALLENANLRLTLTRLFTSL